MIESFKAKHNDLFSRADKVCTPSKPTLFYLTPKTQSIKGYHRVVSLNWRTNIELQVSQLEWISRDKADWPELITLKGRILSVLGQQGKAKIYPKVATTFPEVFRGKTFILTLSYELEYPEATNGSQYQNTIRAHKEIFHVYATANDKEDKVLADLDTLKTKSKQ